MLSLRLLYIYGGIVLLVALFLQTVTLTYFYDWYYKYQLILGEFWTMLLVGSMLVGEYIYRNCIWKKSALYGILTFCVLNIMYETGFVGDNYIQELRYAVCTIALFAVTVFLIRGKVFNIRSSSNS